MMLVELELKNFKTFVGETIKFVGKFIAVTGPNGAGKSNLVDAIAFAAGAKLADLRVSKKGGLGHISAPKNFGTHVKLVLRSDNGDRHSFKRFVDESCSKYFINDNEVSFCKYMEVLKNFNMNIKVKNFIVFQNSVESIIMMKSIERTAMCEELSRSGESKAEYDRLKADILRLEDELRDFLTIKKNINRSIKSTQLYTQEAKIYLQISERNEIARLRLLLFNLYHSRRMMENLMSDEQQLKETKHVLEKGQCRSEKTLRKLLNEQRARAETIAQLEKTRELLEPTIRQIMNVLAEIRSKIEHSEERVRACEKSSTSAEEADAIRQSNIKDLQNALAEVQREKDKYIAEYSSTLGRDVQLSDSQVEEYQNLKLRVGAACANNSQRLLVLDREYKARKDAYDNNMRKLDEARVRIELKRGLRDSITARIEKLKNFTKKKLDDLEIKRAAYDQLRAKIEFSKEQKEDLEREINDINRELADFDDVESKTIRKTEEMVQKLKGQFSGVYDRLGEMCRPIHNRYAIAVTKVFGAKVDAIVVDDEKTAIECIRYLKVNKIGVCIFLPLKQLIEDHKLSEHLRNIRDPPNVKLLYDVIHFSPVEIAPAVFHATQNTLVCETPEDASKVAYELPNRHDCVSLDGCYYRKSGIFSGGAVELARKAKIWDLQKKRALKNRKENLMTRIREIRKEALQESELFELAETIKTIEIYSRYTAGDESNACKELATVENELEILENTNKAAEEKVGEAKLEMDNALAAMRELESANDRTETEIFADFCRQIGTDNIRNYEEGRRLYEEMIKNFEEQIDRIEVQISYESHRDTKTNVERWTKNLNKITDGLACIVKEEIKVQSSLEKEAKKLENCQSECRYLTQLDTDSEKRILELRDELATMAREHKLLSDKISQIQFTMRKNRARYHALLKEAKICGFPIVVNNDQTPNGSQTNESTNTDSSCELRELEALQIDFSKLPEELRDLSEAEIDKVREDLEEIISEQERDMAAITDPDMRASQHLVSLWEKLAEINKKIEAHRRKIKDIRIDFDAAKNERYNRFNQFFDHVSKHIDVIYKQLTKNPSAQAYLIAENPEEPYLAGIEYTCIVPGKRFQVNDNLSGGEKAMAALPLLFAIQSAADKKSPFQIFDEIDAGLDSGNAKKVVEYMQENKATQSIVISHKQEFLAGADSLIGITTRGVGASMESVVFTLDLRVYPERTR